MPGSKLWEFEELKNQVGNKTKGKRELVIVGTPTSSSFNLGGFH